MRCIVSTNGEGIIPPQRGGYRSNALVVFNQRGEYEPSPTVCRPEAGQGHVVVSTDGGSMIPPQRDLPTPIGAPFQPTGRVLTLPNANPIPCLFPFVSTNGEGINPPQRRTWTQLRTKMARFNQRGGYDPSPTTTPGPTARPRFNNGESMIPPQLGGQIEMVPKGFNNGEGMIPPQPSALRGLARAVSTDGGSMIPPQLGGQYTLKRWFQQTGRV